METTSEESPMKGIIDKMFMRIAEPDVKTKKLAQIIEIAYESREGLLEERGLPEHDWWADQAVLDFTEIIVRANYRAHKILNGDLVPDNLEEQLENAKQEVLLRIEKQKKDDIK